MKRNIIISFLILSATFFGVLFPYKSAMATAWESTYYDSCDSVSEGALTCGSYTIYVRGFYGSQSEAEAALTAFCASVGNCGSYGGTFPMTICGFPSSWQWSNKWVDQGYTYFRNVFMYPTGINSECVSPVPTDQDEDGLDDDCDPFPEDDYCFTYQLVLTKRSGGTPYFWLYRVRGRDGNWSYYSVGTDNPSDETAWMEVNPATYTCVTWGEEICGSSVGDPALTDDMTAIEVNTGTTTVDLADGEQPTPGDTDSETLDTIARNTGNSVDNEQVIADLLAEIKDALDNNTEATISTGTTPSGPSAGDIATGIADELEAQSEADKAEGDSLAASEESGWGDAPTFDPDVSEAVPEQTTIGSIFDSFISSNPVSTVLENSGLNASGSCSLVYNYKGTPIEFGVCDYEDHFDAMGVFLLSLSTLASFIMLIRG